MFLEGIILGIVIGFLRRGKLGNLENTAPRRLYLVFIALLIKVSLWADFFWGSNFLGGVAPIVHTLSYLPLLYFIYLNRRSLGLLIIGTGLLLNLAAIAVNAGYMPVDGSLLAPAAQEELLAGTYSPFHRAAGTETRLLPLTDLIRLPYGKHRVISIGDILITAGLIYFIQHGMLLKKEPESKS